jgi:hypothetical protein
VNADAPTGTRDLAREAFDNITASSDPTLAEDQPLAKLPSQFDDTDYHGIAVAEVPKARSEAEVTKADAIGGGPSSRRSDHSQAGSAWLLADWPRNQKLDFGSSDAGDVLLHELGHALGLDPS